MRRMQCTAWIVVILPLAVVFAGCSNSGDERLPTTKVSGTARVDGQPVTSGTITFFPVDGGKQAIGVLDADGAFTLSTYAPKDGAVLGKHKVVVQVSAIGPDGVKIPGADKIPSAYASQDTTPLTIEIDENSDNVVVDLDKK